MSLPQPRRAKSSNALRAQANSQRNLKAPPPLPLSSNVSSIPSTPSISSYMSSRSVSSTSSELQTPPLQISRPVNHQSPRKSPHVNNSLGITERLKIVTSELESYVEETEINHDHDHDNVHVAVRVKPNFSKERDIWTSDPLKGYIGGKLGEFFFGKKAIS